VDAIAPPTADAGVTEARVERTFAFIDLSGFTALTDQAGDAEAVRVLAGFRQAVRQVSSERAVRIAKWLGDGAMLVSINREPLVEAIVEIAHLIRKAGPGLPLRAGIATGPVILFEGDDYIGSAVNISARLCDLAEPGQVIAPASIVTEAMVNTRAEPLGAIEIRGLETPLEIVLLGWPHDRDEGATIEGQYARDV
jgi:class 3 adenylate cyclase